MQEAWKMDELQYILKEPTHFNIKEAIPDNKAFVDPRTYRRGVWTPSKTHKLERGYCHNFNNFKSYNNKASLNYEQLNHA